MPKRYDPNEIVRFAEGRQSLARVTNRTASWKQLSRKLTSENRTAEKLHHYLKLERREQDRLKNTNGYWISGHCANGRRARANVGQRDLVTLDLDDISPELFHKIRNNETAFKGVEHAIHTTRKHTPESPRVRIVVPMKRPLEKDEYTPVARIMSHMLDATMDSVDDVSYRPAQMMFYPSCSADSEFVGKIHAGAAADPDKVLGSWRKKGLDPFDFSTLPFSEAQGQKRRAAEKAEDPWEKSGVVGAFCRTYTIEEAIAEFLSDTYVPGDMTGPKPRYSYAHGTTSNGVEVQDDGRFIYSHHTSDPLSDRLTNAFDAVRIVKFGDQDEGYDGDPKRVGNLPSFKAMADFAKSFDAVRSDLSQSRYDTFEEEFDDLGNAEPGEVVEARPRRSLEPDADEDLLGEPETPAAPAEDATEIQAPVDLLGGVADTDEPEPGHADWSSELDLTENGFIKKTDYNFTTILRHHRFFRGRFRFNVMLNEEVLLSSLTPNKAGGAGHAVTDTTHGDMLEDRHANYIMHAFSAPRRREVGGFGFENVSTQMIDRAITEVALKAPYHPVRERLNSIPAYDPETERDFLGEALIEFFKTEDNAFTRNAFRQVMIAAIARSFEPGTKFDYCLVLQGEQGIGKSSFFDFLSWNAFYGTLTANFASPKDAVEQMRGNVFMELAEMSAYHRSDLSAAKSFLSQSSDRVRLSYDRRAREFKRQSVFIGTVNPGEFLRDPTGNRRFWPVVCHQPYETPIDFAKLGEWRDRIWAQAYAEYTALRTAKPYGPLPLDLPRDADQHVYDAQETASIETAADELMIEALPYLNGLDRKSRVLSGEQPDVADEFAGEDDPMVLRTVVTAKEIWCKALGREEDDLRFHRYTVHDMMNKMPGWRVGPKKRRLGPNMRKVYERVDATPQELQQGYKLPDDEPESDDEAESLL